MSDLTDRLRGLYVQKGTNYVQEAADEIERLQVEYDHAVEQAAKNADEVLALREQLALAESVRAAQVAGLTEGAEALQRDAARYRWLRDCAGRVDWAEHNPTRSGIMQVVSHCRIGPQGMDAAIDAALKGER
jgi:hypothetical protein